MATIGTFLDPDTGAELEAGAVVLDVINSISYQLSGQATSDPVGQEQSKNTDHFIDAPDVLTINASVYDQRAGFDLEPGRSRNIFNTLRSWKSDGRRLGFVAGLRVYPQVVIESVQTLEDSEHEDSLELLITVKEMDVATATISEVPPGAPDPEVAPTKATKRNRDRQNAPPTSEEVSEQGSILYQAFFE